MGRHTEPHQQPDAAPSGVTAGPRVHPVGPLGGVHRRQLAWPLPARVLWWALLLPVAIVAWSSVRLRGPARALGYGAAALVLLVGAAVVTTPASPTSAAASASTVTSIPSPGPTSTLAPPAVSRMRSSEPSLPPPTSPVVIPASPTFDYPGSDTESSLGSASPGESDDSSGSAPGDTYTNVDGHHVQRPMAAASRPSGSSAQCRDGTYSYSEHSRGTCSHHGGASR